MRRKGRKEQRIQNKRSDKKRKSKEKEEIYIRNIIGKENIEGNKI